MSDDVLRDYAWLMLDPHSDCTCCRQWRLVEQPSASDVPLMGTRTSWEGLRPTPLLPPHQPTSSTRFVVRLPPKPPTPPTERFTIRI